jgi:DNA-binding MarR family transcriptional regulator
MVDARMTKGDLESLAEFRYQLRRYLRFSETATRSLGVTPLQYQLMLQIKGYPGRQWATVGELAERLQARHNGVVALVTRCEEAGWVRRVPGRDDQRRVEVHLTDEGERRLARLARRHLDELRSIRAGFAVIGIAPGADAAPERASP